MSLEEAKSIRDNANMIVCGYAFTQKDDTNVQVVQLDYPNHALVLSSDGEVLETSMDDVELEIVLGYWSKNQKYMDVAYA